MDDKNLEYIQTARCLNQWQIWCSFFLADFDFVVTYQQGTRNSKADTLSHKDEYSVTMLKMFNYVNGTTDSCLMSSIHFYSPMTHLQPRSARSWTMRVPKMIEFQLQNGLFCRNGCVYVPEGPSRLQVLKLCHNFPLEGHCGQFKIWNPVSRSFSLTQSSKTFKVVWKLCCFYCYLLAQDQHEGMEEYPPPKWSMKWETTKSGINTGVWKRVIGFL